jgi:hypothetical protein
MHLRCPLNFFIIVLIYWKSASYRSSLDLSSFGKTTNRSAAKLICFFFVWTNVHAIRPDDGSTTPSNRPTGGGRTTNRYATTLEAAPVRAQDAPRRLDWSRIRQDSRQLCGTAHHASTCRKIVRHACKLLPPWPIKGGAVPRPLGTMDSNHPHALRLHHDIGTCLNQYLWYLEARPPLPPRL